ncbi:MAG: glycosyltransferase 87 family protein [Bifidobacterium sp.]|nr:glycosyltransferase 87 family protein [Bifidobacterium sp.]
MTTFLGGRVDKHGLIGRAAWDTPWCILLGVALTSLSLGFLSKANCLHTFGTADVVWNNTRQYTSACYSDIIALYGVEGMKAGHFPYLYSWVQDGQTRYMEYPVLSGLFQWVTAEITRWITGIAKILGMNPALAVVNFSVAALLLAVAWIAALWFTFRLSRHRVWDTLLMAASPLVWVQIFTNFDALAIACCMGGLYYWNRRRYVWAGIFVGLGTAFKLYPVLLLGAFAVLALRSLLRRGAQNRSSAVRSAATALAMRGTMPTAGVDRRSRASARAARGFGAATVAAVIVWLVCNVPIMMLSMEGWKFFAKLNSSRSFEYGSTLNLVDWLLEFGIVKLPASEQSLISLVLCAAACLAVVIFGVKVQREPKVTELTFLLVVAFLMTNKVWSTQYSLWLIPLAVLAVPRWKLVFGWMWVETLVWFAAMWWMMGVDKKGLPTDVFYSIFLVRDALVLAMVVVCVRVMLGRRPAAPSTMADAVATGEILPEYRGELGVRGRIAPGAPSREGELI